jgi:hypothetical protein
MMVLGFCGVVGVILYIISIISCKLEYIRRVANTNIPWFNLEGIKFGRKKFTK